jgi:polyphosphate kinase 2
MKRTKYEKTLRRLQVQLCHLQRWVREKGLRVVVVFEGRDGAGKGGTIRALTERLSPRIFRVVALPAPSDREQTQLYMQRYLQHFPAAGEVVIFDRSWYNRAGVERVMGFCSNKEYRRFLDLCPQIEQFLVEGGVILIKFWLEVTNAEQKRRFEARISDPLRQWKLSPMDLPRVSAGTSTPARATPCSRERIHPGRRGTSSDPMTSERRA